MEEDVSNVINKPSAKFYSP